VPFWAKRCKPGFGWADPGCATNAIASAAAGIKPARAATASLFALTPLDTMTPS
jgi:hypothetical protein